MQTTLTLNAKPSSLSSQVEWPTEQPAHRLTGSVHARIVWFLIKLRIFFFACVVLKRPSAILRTFRKMLQLRSDVWGGDLKKLHKVDSKYYFNQYTPGWPSAAYDDLIRRELRRQASPVTEKERLSFVFLAITRKCPMRCEHCFEWDNLNQKESFTLDDLYKVVTLYQKEGVLQIHFSGGEPMVRFKDLVQLIQFASRKTECWVLTSGFGVNADTAKALKQAGCKGMVISIDHYIPELHDLFRGKQHAFAQAVAAVHAAKQAGLVVSISVCATRTFLEEHHLMPYLCFAKELGVHFVQVLEPRKIGHYADKEVLLDEAHITILEETFRRVNHHPAFRHYPTMLYHGFHQRRVGCFSGSRSVYVDSAGDVHACPFCHTKSYNIIQLVRSNQTDLPRKQNECPLFKKVV